MAGWFPQQADGGIPPNPSDPNNPAQAYQSNTPPADTLSLFYGNGCDVRLRPHVVNSLISENQAAVDAIPGLAYHTSRLTNLRLAIEYGIQKGMPKYTALSGGPHFYNGVLTPPLLSYNDGMVLCVTPNQANAGMVRIDVGGGTWVPVLRNDVQELAAGDWSANVPQLIAYFGGAFYLCGIAQSQLTQVSTRNLRMTFWATIGNHNWTVPADVQTIEVTCTAGGGGGGGSHVHNFAAGGGGAGGTSLGVFNVTPGQGFSVTVGAGGAGGLSSGANGGNGAASQFGALLGASGGEGGMGSNNLGPWGGQGGAGYGGGLSIEGGDGTDGWSYISTTTPGLGGSGGGSYWGGGGRNGTSPGLPGHAWGSGGGGAYFLQAEGGAGARGLVVVRWNG